MKTDPRSDEQLVAAINDGDISAFAVIYYRYRDWVARLARRFVGNDEDALDVLQEAFAYLHRKFPNFELRAKLTTFLYPVVKNVSIAVRRKRRRFEDDEGAIEQAADPKGGGEEMDDLADVLRGLGEMHREVVLMRFVDGMSLEEIGAALGVAVGTVKSRLHYAIRALRDDPRLRG